MLRSSKAPKPSAGQVSDDPEKWENVVRFPDAAHNQAYVGGPHEYQAYQQARLANHLAQENLETAEMYQDASMNWGAWGGWGVGWGVEWESEGGD